MAHALNIEWVMHLAKNMDKKLEKNFFIWKNNCLIIRVLICANTKINKIGKVKGNQLKINITQEAKSGKATKYLLKFLAKELEIKPNSIKLISGEFNPNKIIAIENIVSNETAIKKLQINTKLKQN